MITLTRHGDPNEGTDVIFGRCLGLISNNQLAALNLNNELWRKVYTGPTIPINVVSETNVRGQRLVMAIKKIDGKETYNNEVFVSDELDYVRMSNPANKVVHFECLNSSVWVSIKEE